MIVLEIFIAVSLFNILLYYYLKNRKETHEYYQQLTEMEYAEARDEKEE
ncbi:hypothetical protein ASZ90_019514 [hydrocarbon metagenome]|uniref:Uncharacterized protein n=1 Tax=hydrocarbon metagenome TaxID=938273 RepID=A0A0W8E384_9ZZZZ